MMNTTNYYYIEMSQTIYDTKKKTVTNNFYDMNVDYPQLVKY